MKHGAVVTPLFSMFGPEPIAMRINIGEAQVLVTTDALYRRRVQMMRAQIPTLRHVLLVAEDGGSTNEPDTQDWVSLMAAASDDAVAISTTADDLALLHFTSGTTGAPKGALHVHGAVVTHHATGRYALDLHSEDC